MWRKFRWVADRQCHNRVFFGDAALSRFLRQDYSFDAIAFIRLRRFMSGKLGPNVSRIDERKIFEIIITHV